MTEAGDVVGVVTIVRPSLSLLPPRPVVPDVGVQTRETR